MIPGQQSLLLPMWKQNKAIILKEYASLGAKVLIIHLDRAALLKVIFEFLNVIFSKLSFILIH